MTDPLDHAGLKDKQRALRDGWPLALILRVHRGLSWLRRAEAEGDDADVRFILLWVGFNAAYAGNLDHAIADADADDAAQGARRPGERARLQAYFDALVSMDDDGRIYDLLWRRFGQEIRTLLDNPFVFGPYWRHQAGRPGGGGWDISFAAARRAAHAALARGDTPLVLSILFDRLYVLRNQLIHGGATHGSTANRDQVRDGTAILGRLLPLCLDLMMDHPDAPWSMPDYPLVEE